MLLPELHEARVEIRPGATAELHRLPVGIGRDHETVDPHQRQLIRRISRHDPFGAVAVGNLAYALQWPATDDIDPVLRRPSRALRHRDRVPQRRVWKLRRLHIDRHVLELIVLAAKIHLGLRQRLHDDGIGLDIHRLRLVRIDAEIVQFMRRRAAADADLDPALAQMIQHADFFGKPQRMMRRQHVDQRAEPQAFGTLRHRRQKHAGRWRQIERRRMVLAHVVGAEPGAIVELDQLQPIFILFGERIRPMVVLIEDPELHGTTPSTSFPARHDNIGRGWRVVRSCYSANP